MDVTMLRLSENNYIEKMKRHAHARMKYFHIIINGGVWVQTIIHILSLEMAYVQILLSNFFFGVNESFYHIFTNNPTILYRLKRYLSTNHMSPIEWMISLGNWIRVWKQQFRCQAICYLYLVCDHLLTCLNVWHGENEIIKTDKIWIIPTRHMNMSFKKSHHPNIWVWMQ